MFGLPSYRLLWLLPGIDQLHSPFRWVFAVSLGLAVLAGLGAERLVSGNADAWRRRLGLALVTVGLATVTGLLALRLFFAQLEPLVERVFSRPGAGEPGLSRCPDLRQLSGRSTFWCSLWWHWRPD